MIALAALRSRLGRVLVEPAASVTDIGERHRARLMAVLELVQLLQFIVAGTVLALTEAGEGAVAVPTVLFACVPCTLVTYALTRSRYARVGIHAHVVLNMMVTPVIVFVYRTSPDAFIFFAFTLPSILIANVATSARTTLITGAIGLAAMVVIAKGFGPPSWTDDIRHGIIFLSIGMTLIVAFGIHRDRLEADRSAELRTRNEELEALRRTLELRVEERTRELTRRNAEMSLVLDNVAEGLFAVDRQGSFSSEGSAAFTSWFGRPSPGQSFISFLGRHAPEYALAVQAAWEQVVDDILPLDAALDQIPRRFAVGDRQYELAIAPIGEEQEKLLVVVSDVTSAVAHEKILAERREAFALFEHILAHRAHFLASFEEMSTLVARVLAPSVDRAVFARDLHTLKGNALVLGLESVGAICHALESRFAEEQSRPSAQELEVLQKRWAALQGEVDRLLGQHRHSIELTPAQYGSLVCAIREAKPHEALLRMVVDFKLEPVEPRLRSFAEQTQRLAARLEKEVEVEIENDDDVRVDGPTWAPLWAALVHAVRNAIDHGIEAPRERRAVGKPPCGRIALRAARAGETIAIEVRDDGRGIDWDLIRARAAARGTEADTKEAIQATLFAGGVSTASEVTDLSGRGIGMSALSAAVRELGGTLELNSTKGAGTQLRMVFPPHASAA